MSTPLPSLNWREIAALTEKIAPEVHDMFVDKIVVPERSRFPQNYVKGEWAIRLTSRRQERVLLFSIRPQHVYFTLVEGKGHKIATQATQSPFSLAISKHLRGAKLLSLEAFPRERVVFMRFLNGPDQFGLAICLIPAMPEALLVSLNESGNESGPPWPIIARSRGTDENQYTPPDGARAPAGLTIREGLLKTPFTYFQLIEKSLDEEAFELRARAAERLLKENLKQAKTRSAQSQTALNEAQKEADWQRYGDLLKNHLGDSPPLNEKNARSVLDYTTDQMVDIPCDPKLTPQAQVAKFFHLAHRKNRRREEARTRLEGFSETVRKLERLAERTPAYPDWAALTQLEAAVGIQVASKPGSGSGKSSGASKRGTAWLGKSFTSKDGLPIYVGRSRDENLELTFKTARGNDLWMHVRGRPGAHVLVPLNSGKSAPLETLLDAALLTIFYSGGEKWGKTEVDYTYKKYVKRIKDSTEASYTHNKTLIVEPDQARLKRLLSQNSDS